MTHCTCILNKLIEVTVTRNGERVCAICYRPKLPKQERK